MDHDLAAKKRSFRQAQVSCSCGTTFWARGRNANRRVMESFNDHVSLTKVLRKIHEYNKSFPRKKGEW